MTERGSGYVRDRAAYHVRSADAHLHANDLEPACDDLRIAADLIRRTGSTAPSN